MKKYAFLISALLLFIIINSNYFLEYWMGSWLILVDGLLFLGFLALAVVLLVQITKAIRERGRDEMRITSAVIAMLILITIYIKPNGIINFEKMEGEDFIVASRRGVGGCSTTLKFKEDHKTFVYRDVCFGLHRKKGDYIQLGDTLKLHFRGRDSSNYVFSYGVLKLNASAGNKIMGKLLMYWKGAESTPIPFDIFEYNKK